MKKITKKEAIATAYLMGDEKVNNELNLHEDIDTQLERLAKKYL